MKSIKINFRLAAFLLLAMIAISVQSQKVMRVYVDGYAVEYPISSVDSVTFFNYDSHQYSYEYVDLGLSVMWATCNVGAQSPEEYGSYYAWGETEEKNTYTSSNYKWYDSYQQVLKYNIWKELGNADMKYRLSLEDDAAYQALGEGWRIPTQNEFMELLYDCDWTPSEMNGVMGYHISSRTNGNSIFLPLAGEKWDSNLEGAGQYALYHTNTLYSEQSGMSSSIYSAYIYLYDSGNGWYMTAYDRAVGLPIRPVYSSSSYYDNVMEVKGLSIYPESATIEVGQSIRLSTGVNTNAEVYIVPELSSDNNAVATVDSRVLTGVAPGECVITASFGDYTATCSVTVIEMVPVMEYVDLGLSVNWATCNIGTSKPECQGSLFAWGETEPKQDYYWGNYKYSMGSDTELIKYCTDSIYGYNGYTDGKIVLDPEDDAAQVIWGGNWRMPTFDEFNELLNNCTIEYDYINGMDCYKFTSTVPGYEDKYIIIPLENDGNAYYWSSSLSTRMNSYASFLYNTTMKYILPRYYGFPIRPVCPSENHGVQKYELSLSPDNMSLYVGESTQLMAALNAEIIDGYKVYWFSTDTTVATVSASGVVTTLSTGDCQIIAYLDTLSAICQLQVVEYVPVPIDMGLSVMWASANIGAINPFDYGDYYAWGETEIKDWYNYSTYKWYDDSIGYTKYNLYEKKGVVDMKYRLDPEDDVAQVVWGKEWRVPTNEEFQELIDNCNWYWQSYNGIGGYLAVSKINGESIFLPAGGYKDQDNTYDVDNYGAYMSNSLDKSRTDYYDVLCLEDNLLRNYWRFSGYSVRPVYSSTFVDNVLDISGVTLEENAVTIESGQQHTLNASVQGDSSMNVVWTSDDASIVRVSSKGIIVGVNPGSCNVTASCAGFSQTCTVTVTQSETVIEYVDLGLSVKWATCNVGASRPEYYGGLYAWGETEQKGIYNWNSYRFANGSGYDLTKYCNNSEYGYEGFADDKTVLDPEDDVAHVLWQGDWRMPSAKELMELMDKCDWTWVDSGDASGYMVTGPNGNSIFMPTPGYSQGGTYNDGYIYLYTISINEELPYCADYFYGDISQCSRYIGFPVRPVCQFSVDELTSISLNNNSIKLFVGESASLNLVADYIDNVEWMTTDNSVAVYENGEVRGVSIGSCYIIASVGNLTDSCLVEVIGPEYVDLGLSMNWATFNVGAHSPEEYGDYYAWGEIEPKTNYNWVTYKWYESGMFTKYCESDSLGYGDGKNVLDPEDDVAHVKWGGDWQMPSPDDWMELFDKCTWEWTEQNGIGGYLVTSNVAGYTDRSIFIPASGYRANSSIYNVGEWAPMWSSYGFGQKATYADFYDVSDLYCYDAQRALGFTVRPVVKNNDYVERPELYFEDDSLYLVTGSVLWLAIKDENGKYCNPYAVWSSSNDEVVSVDSEGEITALSAGYAVITAQYNGLTAVCTIRVVDPYYDPGDSIQAYYEESADGLQIRLTYSDSELSALYIADFYESDSLMTDSLYMPDSLSTSYFICYSMTVMITFADDESAREAYNEMIETIPKELTPEDLEKLRLTLNGNVISAVVYTMIGKEKSVVEAILRGSYEYFKANNKIELNF